MKNNDHSMFLANYFKYVVLCFFTYSFLISHFFQTDSHQWSCLLSRYTFSGRYSSGINLASQSKCLLFITWSTGWSKSHDTEKKLNYLPYGLSNGADFFTNNKDVYIGHIHRDKVGKNLFEVSLFIFTKKVLRFIDRK
jgi:hypothetical protein